MKQLRRKSDTVSKTRAETHTKLFFILEFDAVLLPYYNSTNGAEISLTTMYSLVSLWPG